MGSGAVGIHGAGASSGLTDAELRATPVEVEVTNDITLTGPVEVDQGAPAATADAWPVKVTDGTTATLVRAAGSKPDYDTDAALVVTPREVELHNTGKTMESFLMTGGYDQFSNISKKLPLRSEFDPIQKADSDPGVLVRPLNPVFATGTTFTANGTLAANMVRYNAATVFINVVDNGAFNGSFTVQLQNDVGTSYQTFAFNVLTGERVTSLVVGNAYFVTVAGVTNVVVSLQNFVAGSATVRVSVSPEPSGMLTSHISGVTPSQKAMSFGSIAQGGAGTTTLVAADATRKVKVVSYQIVMDGAGTLKFSDGTADLSGVMPIADMGRIDMCGQPFNQVLETAAINRPFNIVTTGGAAQGHFSYFLEV